MNFLKPIRHYFHSTFPSSRHSASPTTAGWQTKYLQARPRVHTVYTVYAVLYILYCLYDGPFETKLVLFNTRERGGWKGREELVGGGREVVGGEEGGRNTPPLTLYLTKDFSPCSTHCCKKSVQKSLYRRDHLQFSAKFSLRFSISVCCTLCQFGGKRGGKISV